MRCLVTGSAGFLGSHMVDRLTREGHTVFCVDSAHPAFGECHDIRRDLSWGTPVDWVFHFAGLAAIPPSFERPAEYMAVNVQGTANVLEAAREAGAKRFIYAASGTCYGNHPEMPTSETHRVFPHVSPYALSKCMGEELMYQYDRLFDLPSVSLRLFSPYGPRMGLTSAMGHFLKLARENKPITITGDGEQFRDMHYVDDCIDAFYRAAQSDVRNVAINIGSGQRTTINQLVRAIIKESGSKSTVEYIPARKEAPGTHADISLAKRLLGWEPTVSFEEGIRRTVAG
jgi:UDP-glucose 4-epimerase